MMMVVMTATLVQGDGLVAGILVMMCAGAMGRCGSQGVRGCTGHTEKDPSG